MRSRTVLCNFGGVTCWPNDYDKIHILFAPNCGTEVWFEVLKEEGGYEEFHFL